MDGIFLSWIFALENRLPTVRMRWKMQKYQYASRNKLNSKNSIYTSCCAGLQYRHHQAGVARAIYLRTPLRKDWNFRLSDPSLELLARASRTTAA